VPFAGIAFLWFIGVLRDRLGEREDKFFAMVFFGSGLLFLAMLFSAAAVAGALIISFEAAPAQLINSGTFHFARATAYSMMNVYTIKTASVFMITTIVRAAGGVSVRIMKMLPGYLEKADQFAGMAAEKRTLGLRRNWRNRPPPIGNSPLSEQKNTNAISEPKCSINDKHRNSMTSSDDWKKTIRLNKLLGMWAAEKLGIIGRDAEAYSDALAVGTLDPERSDVLS
jgi:hypothetical protein